MSVFSYLQNQISNVSNDISSGVSNVYHAAVNNIGPYVSRVPQAASQAGSSTLNFVKSISSPFEGAVNATTQGIRGIGVLGGTAANYALNPSQGLGNSYQEAQKIIPQVPQLTYAQQGAKNLNIPYAQQITNAGTVAGGVLPYLAAPELATENPYLSIAAKSAAFGGYNTLGAAGAGANPMQLKQAAEQGALTGLIGETTGILNPIPDLGSGALSGIPRMVGGALTGYGLGKLSGQNTSQAVQSALISGLSSSKQSPYFDTLLNQKNYQRAENLYNAPVPEEPVTAKGIQVMHNGEPLTKPIETFTTKVPLSTGDKLLLNGTYQPVISYAGAKDGGIMELTVDPRNNQIVSWKTDDPNYLATVKAAAQGPLLKTVSPSTPEEIAAISKAKGKAADLEAEYNLEGAQFRNRPLPQESTDAALTNLNKQAALKDQNLPLKDITKEALQQRQSLAQQIRSYGTAVNNVVSKLSATDSKNLAHALEHPSEVDSLTKSADNPTLFAKAVETTKAQLTNAENARMNSSATPIGHTTNYFPHDLTSNATPEEQVAALENAGFSSGDAQNFVAKSSKERILPDIRTAESIRGPQGEQIFTQNPNSAQVLKNYFSSQALEAGNSALTNTLGFQAPEHINTGGQLLIGPDGKSMKSLNGPGLGGTAVSQELHQQLQGLEPSIFNNNKTIQTIDKASGLLKSTKLGIGGFHTLSTGLNDLAPEIMQGRFSTLPRAFAAMVSGDYRAASLENHINNGTVDWLSKAGATVGKGPDGLGETLAQKAQNLNPVERFSNGVFNGFINEIKFSLGDYYRSKGIDPTSTEGRQIGTQINNLFGGIDKVVLNRNQTLQQMLRIGSISPDFTEGKLRSGAAAANLSRWDPGANLARSSVVGKVALSALIAEVANRITTGKWDTSLTTFLKQRVLDPQFSLPSQFQKPGSINPVVAHLPSNLVSDVNKIITNPSDFLTARAGSAVSLINQALTNKDYYGRQIYNPNDSLITKAEKVGQTQLPIFANNLLALKQGKESAPTAALNTAGLRVTTDPNAPSVIALTAQENYAKTLDAKSAADYAALHPPTQDAAGNPIGSKDILSSPERSAIYLNNPQFLAEDTKIAKQAGGPQDPFYTSLSPDQQRLVLAAALKVPGQTNNYTKALYSTSWYQPFLSARDAFYNSLPASKTPPAVVTPTVNVTTGQALTSTQQSKAYDAQALSQLGLPSTLSSTSSSSGKIASIPKIATGGIKLSKSGRSVKGGKLTIGHLKPVKAKAIKSLTLKNVAGTTKQPKLTAPRAPRGRTPKLSQSLSGRSLRRKV